MFLIFVNANVIVLFHHFLERRVFVGENTKGALGKVQYKFYIVVITSHVFDQVQVFFIFAQCIAFKVRLDLEYVGTWSVLGKEDLDDHCHQL